MKIFPHIVTPTLNTLHPSLANRAHLGAYIAWARDKHFPHGTDWKGDILFLMPCSTDTPQGVQHLKKLQDTNLPAHLHYICVMLELNDNTLAVHDEDDNKTLPSSDKKTCVIICMAPDSSTRLQQAQYLQSDIGFKRIVGFDEFEIVSMDRDANTSEHSPIVFARPLPSPHQNSQVLSFIGCI
jgi:hypothetical protein